MPDDVTISLKFVKPRPSETVCTWLSNPETLLGKLTQHLVVPGDSINKRQFFVYSATQPGQDDQDKIWVKTSSPYGIGFFAGGSWQVAYSIPPGLIYSMSNLDDIPLGFSEVSTSEAAAIGLPALSGGRYVKSK